MNGRTTATVQYMTIAIRNVANLALLLPKATKISDGNADLKKSFNVSLGPLKVPVYVFNKFQKLHST
jgi:hypothetical protein